MQIRPALVLAIAALAFATPAMAQQIYKWKDAKGVTHYSERPPAQGNYSSQQSARDPATATPASGQANAAPAADPRCDTARSNLAALNSGQPVQMDSDGDGQGDGAISDAERQSQINLARSTLEAYNCTESGGTQGAGAS